MRRRTFLGWLPVAAVSPAAWGAWRAEQWAVTDLPSGQVELRVRVRHAVTGATQENAVRVQPAEGGALRSDERARAVALGRAMLEEWLRRQNGVGT